MTHHAEEWIETDGLGGFAMGTNRGPRTRRYHGLLVHASRPPAGRLMLVNGFDAWIDLEGETVAISSQHYAPGVLHPDGAERLLSFQNDPWPTWRYRLTKTRVLVQELFMAPNHPATFLRWKIQGPNPSLARLRVRPFFSGRDFHQAHHENNAFTFEPERPREGELCWRFYPDLPRLISASNAQYRHDPLWYRNFLYSLEAERGLEATEDLASPGELSWDLHAAEAVWVIAADTPPVSPGPDLPTRFGQLADREAQRRSKYPSPTHRAGDAYLVRRGEGHTIIAGYPWFGDWGRDTFISLRGLCLATGRIETARQILVQWAQTVSQGMLPNRFPDWGQQPEYNSVDASLWYIIAVADYPRLTDSEAPLLQQAVDSILEGYAVGTRYGIRMDTDGLLAAGEAGWQLTWMDAKVGDWVVTPRHGKPVEVQALWLNALQLASSWNPRWLPPYKHGLRSFRQKFWNDEAQCLYDVVDQDHRPGNNDASMRPNQIFAVGGLPQCLLEPAQAEHVVRAVEKHLYTPAGLRSLAPADSRFRPVYQGGVLERDGSYHQGTVWPWLVGAFAEALLRVGTDPAHVRLKCLAPLPEGHVAEIADGNSPHQFRGCPFQAWSVGERLRIERLLSPAST